MLEEVEMLQQVENFGFQPQFNERGRGSGINFHWDSIQNWNMLSSLSPNQFSILFWDQWFSKFNENLIIIHHLDPRLVFGLCLIWIYEDDVLVTNSFNFGGILMEINQILLIIMSQLMKFNLFLVETPIQVFQLEHPPIISCLQLHYPFLKEREGQSTAQCTITNAHLFLFYRLLHSWVGGGLYPCFNSPISMLIPSISLTRWITQTSGDTFKMIFLEPVKNPQLIQTLLIC